ncbi:MAG: hypothetical protein OXD42_12990, partial [Rhodospirillaceae bacterium]|nr:hypothetical protein [Rhodospirillaceae bacterium]
VPVAPDTALSSTVLHGAELLLRLARRRDSGAGASGALRGTDGGHAAACAIRFNGRSAHIS